MLKRTKIIASSIAAPITLVANAASAAIGPTGVQAQASLERTLNTILNWSLGIAGLIAAVYILIAGFSYITSSGNPEKVQTATKSITYAIIGIIVVGLAFAIKSYVMTAIFGRDIQSPI